jgi:hypothetical protein
MGLRVTALVIVIFASIATVCPALSQIITTPDIDTLCRSAVAETHRATIVYVDLSSIKKGNDEWGYTILKKLELAPRERLTVLGVDPSSFEVLEVFDSCYPTLSQSEIAQIREKRGLWDKLTLSDPESQQRDNLQTFDARLRNSLDRIAAQAVKFVSGKRRDVLGAIAVDKNRFTKRDAYYRMVIFTNGTVSDDFESGLDEAHIAEALVKKYPTSFSGAEVWIFGVTGDDRNTPLESKEKIFSTFFLSSGAHVQSFTLSLPKQTDKLYSALSIMNGSFEGGGIKGSVKLAFTTTNEGQANAWLAFIVGPTVLYVPIEANYSCGQGNCTLKGTTVENVPLQSTTPYFRKGDQLVLKGANNEKLDGTISSEAAEVFKGGSDNEVAKYKLEFSRQY